MNPFSTPAPWDAVAVGYERTTKKVLGLFAKESLKKVSPPKNSKIIDIACGPGTLALLAAKNGCQVEAIDFSKDMIRLFNKEIKKRKIQRIKVQYGDGQNLPYTNNVFDAAFSMFGLMFFPDRLKGFSEMIRVLKPGGKAAVTSWAPVNRSPVMKLMFGAINEMVPQSTAPKKAIRSLEDPRVFREEMKAVGFKNIKIIPLVHAFPVGSVSKFWNFMVEGSAPLVMMRKKMGLKLWNEKEKLALQYLKHAFKNLPPTLTSQAWLGLGEKAL